MTVKGEEFSESQKKILEKFVSNTTENIFVLKNLPEVVKGALFSRYSRSTLGLRSLLLKEFILNEDVAFHTLVGEIPEEKDSVISIKRAQEFYERILDGYGDDSIAELGGAHVGIENISMIAAKVLEDCRIGGSPLEKSTRYIPFDQKIDDAYRFYREPVLMTSAYRDLYINTCNLLFDTYSKLIPLLTTHVEKKIPRETHVSESAYTIAVKARVLDSLRGLLPASTLTNLGIFANGRFYEHLIKKLVSHNLNEMQEIGKGIYEELSKVIPSFIKRSDPSSSYQQSYNRFMEQMATDLNLLTQTYAGHIREERVPGVSLIAFDPHAVSKVAAVLLFEKSSSCLAALEEYCRDLSDEDLARILDAAAISRENRRHKSPRALEHAHFTFEIVADFGVYRDLQRHRILTQERQLLTCNLGYFLPPEIMGTDIEKDYIVAMEEAKKAFDVISQELPEEGQYVVPMAYNMHWYFHLNLRSLQWLCELRSSPAGHANYRRIAQKMARQVCGIFPQFERFFKFVNFENYELGRMEQEEKRLGKQEKLTSSY